MKPPKSSTSFGIVALLLLGLPLSPEANNPATQSSESVEAVLASQIIGSRVESPGQDRLGRVAALVIDLQTGQVPYVVVAAGGFLGLMAELRPVPPESFSIREAARGITLVLDLPQEQWDEAPSVDRLDHATRLGVERHARHIYQFYGQKWDARLEAARRFEDPELATPEETLPKIQDDPFRRLGRLRLVDDLIGLRITTRLRREIGEIDDFLLHLPHGRVLFTMVRPITRFWERTDETYAVVPHALVVQAEEAFLHIDPQALPDAPILSEGNLAAESRRQGCVHPAEARERPVVFRYEPATSPGQAQTELSNR